MVMVVTLVPAAVKSRCCRLRSRLRLWSRSWSRGHAVTRSNGHGHTVTGTERGEGKLTAQACPAAPGTHPSSPRSACLLSPPRPPACYHPPARPPAPSPRRPRVLGPAVSKRSTTPTR
eukprot:165457-Rhodomonas_salina.1